MWELFQAGGPVMWPLLLCSMASLAVILERAWFLGAAKGAGVRKISLQARREAKE